jgi:outer membrane protein TolC
MRVSILLFAAIAPGVAQTLTLDDVVDSATRYYPPLLAAVADQDIAEGEVLSALGKFDLILRAGFDTDQFGYYRNERFATRLEQPLQTWGSTVYGGWRVGEGTFAPYDGKLDTRSGGEWSSGIKLPLFRDRVIDGKRADLRKAEIGRLLARLSVNQVRLLIGLQAARAYWEWVAAAGRLKLARALLDVALSRDRFLRESVEAGQVARIEVVENARAILQRRSSVVAAERALQQAAIFLSLFLRDQAGEPVLAPADRAPVTFPDLEPVDPARLQQDIAEALRTRPDLARFDALQSQLDVDRRLAINDRKPAIDLFTGFTSETGQGVVRRGPREMKAGVLFELPFQRRVASGKLAVAEAKLKQVDQRERFMRDQIAAEVRDAGSALNAAYDQASILRDEVRVARELEDAERSRFQLGDGTLFLVNLREQATADAITREIGAQNEFFKASALYKWTLGTMP